MKKKNSFWLLKNLILLTATVSSSSFGIGISPARWPADLLEYNCTFDSVMSYDLTRPSSRRYSQFSVSIAAGLIGTITGSSASSGIEYLDDRTVRIDWHSVELSSLGSITVSTRFQSPESWQCPVEPGGNSYFADLVRHSEMVDTGSGLSAGVAAVSEIAFSRNYAPRVYAVNAPHSAFAGQCANFAFQFEDKQAVWFSKNSHNPWFYYEIDWEGDGLTDLSGTAQFDETPTPHSRFPSLSTWTGGIQISTLSVGHVYDTPGNYSARILVQDIGILNETTYLQIPIEVIPEPATLILLGAGGILIRKKSN